jgi:hypothetical protein
MDAPASVAITTASVRQSSAGVIVARQRGRAALN